MVFSHAGKQNRSVTADDWAKQAEATGAGEILITSIDREGMMNGYDIDLIKIVSRSINIPSSLTAEPEITTHNRCRQA